ncbi:S-phase kinase-associated protein 2 [Cimex lectularius]|uniref:F-box domain-containing protein n=1 Tax=Cimex lectularius TaxID=79782 RepID=A0A8I6S3S8_CIMLE|nr:S-phase kinase-associated protein 2 [Cimex lectularius]
MTDKSESSDSKERKRFKNIVDLSPEDIVDLGVTILPMAASSVQQVHTTTRHISPHQVYNDYAKEQEAEYFYGSREPMYLQRETFTYRRMITYANSEDFFSKLSDEIILCIFSHLRQYTLTSVAQVNQRFRRLAMDESLWQRIDVSKQMLKPHAVGSIISRGVRVLKMTRSYVVQQTKAVGNESGSDAPKGKVEYLDLSEAVIAIDDLLNLCKRLYNLKKLSLERCVLSSEIMIEISKNKKLETLNLAMCNGICDKGINAVVKSCQRLESLNVAWTGLKESAVNKLVSGISPSIKKLNLSGHQLSLTDKHVITLIKRCPDIEELDISDCLEVTTASVNALSESLYRLRSLSISRCYKIDPLALTVLSSLPNLESINAFRQITMANLAILETRLPGVRFNKDFLSTIARPCTGIRRTSIWKIRVRD